MFTVWDIPLYYYGLAYTIGFLGVHVWLMLRRKQLGLTRSEVYDFSILFAVCVLVFGRIFEIAVYEWDYYREHMQYLFSYWRGGMASHGVLTGATVGTLLFCFLRKKRVFLIADEVVIPAAFFLGLGRIGNFINGQIFGWETNVWWGVKFPDAEGFRHPVALYESLKNFLIIPVLLIVKRITRPGQGLLLAHFVFWYGFLRLFSDYFRQYGGDILGIGTGQYYNIFMSLLGIGLIVWRTKAKPAPEPAVPVDEIRDAGHGISLNVKRILFILLLLFCLCIPSSWTQGVLLEYREQQRTQETVIE
jgi:phosphatidylglycerol:prolipoprotein diacylglycerol transferase